MKLTHPHLGKFLKLQAALVSGLHPSDALAYIQFTATKQACTITTTDGTSLLRIECESDSQKSTEFCIEASAIKPILSSITDTLTIVPSKAGVTLKVDNVSIVVAKAAIKYPTLKQARPDTSVEHHRVWVNKTKLEKILKAFPTNTVICLNLPTYNLHAPVVIEGKVGGTALLMPVMVKPKAE